MPLTIHAKDLQPIYIPKKEKPMRLAVFGSGSGTNLEALLKHKSRSFQIVAAFADRKCRFLEIAEKAGISSLYLSFLQFKKEKTETEKEIKTAYDNAILQLLIPFHIDLILLAGYMRVLHRPLLDFFSDRIINVHPADLSLRDAEGNRRFVGSDGVGLALRAGKRATRSTIHLVDEHVDTGPVLLFGNEVPYTLGEPITDEKIKRHQEIQKKESDWPACVRAIELIAKGRVMLGQNKKVFIDD